MAIKPVKIRAKMRGDMAVVKSLMPHPMETGVRKDPDGNLIPAHFIQEVRCEHNGNLVLQADWGASVSKDPYFSFKVAGAKSGDTIKVSWVDNLGQTSSGEATLK